MENTYALNKILDETVKKARELNIPVSDRIIPNVYINGRRKTILGTCERQKNGQYKIVISAFVLDGGEYEIRNVIAHEVLHTCRNCSNHGYFWKIYAKRLGQAIGQEIKREGRSVKADELRRNAPYEIVCKDCGKQLRRYRKSALIKHPERYRCICGGEFYVKG